MLRLANGKPAEEEVFANILTAQTINRIIGASVVAPWELGQLSDEYLLAFHMLAVDFPQLSKGIDRVQGTMNQIFAKHPTFGKLQKVH